MRADFKRRAVQRCRSVAPARCLRPPLHVRRALVTEVFLARDALEGIGGIVRQPDGAKANILP